MTSTVPAGVLSSRTHLYEHCDACTNGVTNGPPDGSPAICRECGGSTRRLRGTHDARSAIDFDGHETAPHGSVTSGWRQSTGSTPAHGVAPAEYGASPFYALVPLTKRLLRMRELARTLRDASNSAPLTELLDLIEANPTPTQEK